jgi:integrase/recombinase XerD
MASVKLRKRKNNDGSTSLYLDYYYSYTDLKGDVVKKRKYEFLDECKQIKIVNPTDRVHNKNVLLLADQIRNAKETELITKKYNVMNTNLGDVFFKDFCSQYLEHYSKKNKKNVRATIAHFFSFLSSKGLKQDLFCAELTEIMCEDYLEYLTNKFNGETIQTYFRLFKSITKNAHKKGYLGTDVAISVICKSGTAQKKDILDFTEIAILASAKAPNQIVKHAFLFSCYTGLRWVDVNNLIWQNIQNDRLKFTQVKTNHLLDVQLHGVAIKLLGEKGKPGDKIFNLPSHAGATKSLKKWCLEASIHKNITWHCARHSFGTNIIFHSGTDVNTASKLLGHKSLQYTQRYVHEVESLKQKAVETLPTIDF